MKNKKEIKQRKFFVPTKGKIILAIILYLIPLFILYRENYDPNLLYNNNFLYWISLLYIPVIIISFFFSFLTGQGNLFDGVDDRYFVLFFMILNIAYVYLISCIITYIYNKLLKELK